MINADPVLLVSNDEIAIAGIIHFFARKFGQELGDQVNSALTLNASPNWFISLKQARQAAGQPTYDDFHDPRFLLKECLDEDGIVHFGIEGFNSEWKVTATFLRRRLNSWYHGSLEPNLDNFIQVIEPLRALAEKSKMTIEPLLMASLNRARAIQSGHYAQKQGHVSSAVNVADAEFAKKLAEKKAAIEKRPPIGSEWTGTRGTRKIVISKILNDVTENGNSIRDQLRPDPDEVIESWLRYYPLGGEAKVAEDGAVMGFKLGQAYLIGWLGAEAKISEPDQVQGFILPHEYIFTHSDVRDLASGKLLSVDATENPESVIKALEKHLSEGDFFSATAYGELVLENDPDKSTILTTVHKDIWFKGHLPG